MSLKSSIQVIILIIIFIIIGGVYLKYFSSKNILVSENLEKTEENFEKIFTNDENIKKENSVSQKAKTENKLDEERNTNDLVSSKKNVLVKNKNLENNKSLINNKNEMPNIVKDVEYLTTDKNGNKYKILATSGRTNKSNINILDLENVNGEITSDKRSSIYITSDFAEYNSSSLESKFYTNVIINYEDKKITCEKFDINMDTNVAIAYNNVVVTDPKSIMKANNITLNIETKEIEINPEKNKKNKVKIKTIQ